MGSSAVVNVKKALRDLLQANPLLDGVQVSYFWPGDTVERDAVFFGDASFTHEPAGMRTGRTPRNETAEIEVVCQKVVVGEDAEECEERCLDMGQAVEQTVADHRVFGSDVADGISVYAVTIRRGTLRTRPTADGFMSQLSYTLRPDSRLT